MVHVLDFHSLENERSVDVEVVVVDISMVVVVAIDILEIMIQEHDDVIHHVRTMIVDVVIHVREVPFNMANAIIRLVHVHVHQHRKLVEIVNHRVNVRRNNSRSLFNDTTITKIKKSKNNWNQLNFFFIIFFFCVLLCSCCCSLSRHCLSLKIAR